MAGLCGRDKVAPSVSGRGTEFVKQLLGNVDEDRTARHLRAEKVGSQAVVPLQILHGRLAGETPANCRGPPARVRCLFRSTA